MAQSVLEMAKDLVMAQVQAGRLPAEDMQQALHETYRSLMVLKAREEAGSVVAVGVAEGDGRAPVPVNWKQSITRNAVTCLECGETFKQISVRHLRQHGLDPRSYRAKYGIPRTQPLAAKATTAVRKRIVQRIRPWEKAPRYREAKEREEAKWKEGFR